MTDEQIQKQAETAVDMLIYCYALYQAITELRAELVKEGKFKQRVKQIINNTEAKSDKIATYIMNVVFREKDVGAEETLHSAYCRRTFDFLQDTAFKARMFGSHKWYQIVVALSRLIEEKNRDLQDCYYFADSVALYGMKSKLNMLGYTPDEMIYRVIKNIDTKTNIEE